MGKLAILVAGIGIAWAAPASAAPPQAGCQAYGDFLASGAQGVGLGGVVSGVATSGPGRGGGHVALPATADLLVVVGGCRAGSPARHSGFPTRLYARASTRPSASAKKAFSSGEPTEMRSACGAPKPASGRTITPSRRSAS